ncbi:MAG: PKD domain-containing protein, partial [Solirubrobacteraceae bacterium]
SAPSSARPAVAAAAGGGGAPAGSLGYGGGPVMHSSRTYAIFWDPGGSLGADFVQGVRRFLGDVGQDSGTPTNVYGVATEYGDAAGKIAYQSSFGGSYVDTTPYPLQSCSLGTFGLVQAPCLTDAVIADEIAAVIAANGWSPGLDRAYFVLMPSGVVSCENTTTANCSSNAYCAYHSQRLPDAAPVIYAVIPWAAVAGCQSSQRPNASESDPAVNLISHEHIEMLTDPIIDRPGWLDPGDGSEIADKCLGAYGVLTGPAGAQYNETIDANNYLLQAEFSNARGGCAFRAADNQAPTARFTAASADAQRFALDASGSTDADGRIVSYSWDFGDGQSATGTAAQASHAFAGTGPRTVTLTVRDNAGGTAGTAENLTVGAPAVTPPATPTPTPTPTPSPTPSPSPAAPTTPATATPAAPLPAGAQPAAGSLAAAATPAAALKISTHFGLLHYSGLTGSFTVDRRVQARVDLLIPRSTAVRLGITAQADGSPTSLLVIVGHATVAKAGPGRVSFRVRMPRATAAILRRFPALTVMVRLTLRPGGVQAPQVLGAARRLRA